MYYLQDGLGSYPHMKGVGKVLAVIFAICAVFASFGIGNMGQVNKIVLNFTSSFDIKPLSSKILYTSNGTDITLYMLVVGIVLMVLVGVVVIERLCIGDGVVLRVDVTADTFAETVDNGEGGGFFR